MKEVKVKIKKQKRVDIADLTPFQGSLKTLSPANYEKLKKTMLDEGFTFMIHVWHNANVTYIIDGHQRVATLTRMREEGFEIPPIPCAFVDANTYHDAKKLVLLAVSQYGKIDKDGILEFVDGEDFDFDDFDLPDFDSSILESLKPDDIEREEKEDDIPEVDENIYGVKRGDIWLMGAYLECDNCGKSFDYHPEKVDQICGACNA